MSQNPNFDDSSLDSMWNEVKVRIAATPLTPVKKAPEDFLSTYSNPANWTVRRHVALVHGPSGTLIGAFAELFHMRVAGVKRLVRVDGPVSVSGTEFVTEPWWIASDEPKVHPIPQHVAIRNWLADSLILPGLAVHAEGVHVRVRLSYGAIARIELIEGVTFRGDSGTLFLPAGTDVLKGLSQEAKIEIRKGVGL